jgi:hypothetical protein
MEWQNIVALVISLPFILLPIGFVWYLTVGGPYQSILGRRARQLSCSADTDCPPGYICAGGVCVPASAS